MPFKSEAQRRWMYANKPEMAEEWEKETPKGRKLPKRLKKPAVSKKQVHQLAEKLNIPWDDDPKFMRWTKKLTGKTCLDKMTGDELGKVYRALLRRGKEKVAYVEEGSFTHDGTKYDLGKAFRKANTRKTREYRVSDLEWVLRHDKPKSRARVQKANLDAPILVAKDKKGRLTPVDGLHRLAKAKERGVKTLPGKALSKKDLTEIRIKAHDRKMPDGSVVRVEEHTRKRSKKKEFAPGIPHKDRFAEIPDKPGEWDYVVQDHHARRAGRHYDLRLSDGRVAHSWALRHLPNPGEMTLAVQQPTHTVKYMSFEGVIPPGYGAGTVKRAGMGKVEVLESGPNKVVFNKYDGKRTNEYALIRTKSMLAPDKYGRQWLLVNRSTVEGKYDYPRSKDSYKSMKYGDHLALEEGVMQPKVDGAHALIVLQTGKRPRVFSYRKSKRGDILEYTHKIPGLFQNKVPKGTGNVVLRAEIYLADKSGAALPAERTAGILNSGILKAREAQKGTGGLRLIPFDIVTKKPMSYEKKLDRISALSAAMPFIGRPEAAVTKEDKLKMLRDVRAGKHPMSSEGVIIWRDTGAIKAKVTDDADVYVRDVFPGEGKHKGRAGGFTYSRTPGGPVVGRVGTGLSDKVREQLWQDRDKLRGRVATVTYNKETSRGSLFAPRFMRWHVDKNLGEKLKTAERTVRVKGHSRTGKDGRVRRVKEHTRRYSAAAVAHELGHVKRFKGPKGRARMEDYQSAKVRAALVTLGGILTIPLVTKNAVLLNLSRFGVPLAYAGAMTPVLVEEYHASKEGLASLRRTGALSKEEYAHARNTLGAAFGTYALSTGAGAMVVPAVLAGVKGKSWPFMVMVPSLLGIFAADKVARREGKTLGATQIAKLQEDLGTDTNIVALKKGLDAGPMYVFPQNRALPKAARKGVEAVLEDPSQAESLYRDGGLLLPVAALSAGQRLKVTPDMTPEQRAKKLKQIRHYWKMKKGGGRG